MQQKLFFSLFFLFFIFSSCEFGVEDFFGRRTSHDERASTLVDVTEQLNKPPFTTWRNKTEPTQWRFLIVTDMHFDNKFSHPFEAFLDSITDEKSGKPDFVIMLGDSAEGGREHAYDDYENFLKRLREKTQTDTHFIPDVAVLGNHDIYKKGWALWQKARASTEKYPTIDNSNTFYKFETQTPPNSDGKTFKRSWYFLDSASSTLGNKQMKSFQENLKNDNNDKFIFTHYPFFAQSANIFDYYKWTNTYERAILFDLFDKSKVNMLFTGHWHHGGSYLWGSFFELNAGSFYSDRSGLNHWYYVTVDEERRFIAIEEYKTQNSESKSVKKEQIHVYSF
ncbi:MAG: metallophosphoesterase family protein [Treponemataceae bacterium]